MNSEWDAIQDRAVEALLASWTSGKRGPVLVGPTGSGKTTVAAMATEALVEGGKTVGILTNRRMMVDQLARSFTEHGIDCGVRAAGHRRRDHAPVQVVSIATERSRVKSEEWEAFVPDYAIVDEPHVLVGTAAVRHFLHRVCDKGGRYCGLTATPVDLADDFDDLIVFARPSELRACGALVPAVHYGPDEPDVRRHKKLTEKLRAGLDLPEEDAATAIMTPGLFGRVWGHYLRLNPERKPTILFAPSKAGSLWFAEQFWQNGVTAAHIDGEGVWWNGEEHSGKSVRDDVREASKAGELAVVCNRFVMREGVDWKWLEHVIFATIFGSLVSYIQSGGRGLRASPSTGKERCLASGTMILTNQGEVPIQHVTLDHKLWDGVSFVSHKGAVCRGVQAVVTYDGITGTPDHEVMTDAGWQGLAEAAHRRCRITRSGSGRHPLRVAANCDPADGGQNIPTQSGSRVWPLQEAVYEQLPQHAEEAEHAGLPGLQSKEATACAEVGLRPVPVATRSLHQPQQCDVPQLRGPWHRVQVPEPERGLGLGGEAFGGAEGQADDPGSHRQRRPLRTGQLAVGRPSNPAKQPEGGEGRPFQVRGVPPQAPGSTVLGHDPDEAGVQADGPGNRGPLAQAVVQAQGEVWDILDAGPLRRFTANGRLVHNCVIQDHGGNWLRHGSLNADRDWYLDGTRRMYAGLRADRIRCGDEKEPARCPKCAAIQGNLYKGRVCSECGYVFETHRRSRPVATSDDQLIEVAGDVYLPRAERFWPDTAELWAGFFWRARGAKRPQTFTQAETNFFREHKYYPPRDLPLMPLHEADWYRHVKDVAPKDDPARCRANLIPLPGKYWWGEEPAATVTGGDEDTPMEESS